MKQSYWWDPRHEAGSEPSNLFPPLQGSELNFHLPSTGSKHKSNSIWDFRI